MNLFTDYAVGLDAHTAQAGTPVYIAGIQNVSLNSGLQTLAQGGNESIYNTHGALVSGAPAASLSTIDLKTFLDQCGVTAMKIDNGLSGDGLILYCPKYAPGASREANDASTHWSATLASGMLVPRTLSVSHQQTAAISADAIATFDGTTAPVTFAETADLPAGIYPSVAAEWTLGKIMLNAVPLTGLQNVTIDFGIQLIVRGSDSSTFPLIVSVEKTQPVITVVGAHIGDTATLTEQGVYYTAEQVVLYLKKKAEGGTFVVDGTAEHIKMTLGKARADWVSIDGNPKTITMRLTSWYTAGVAPISPLAINTASAIT